MYGVPEFLRLHPIARKNSRALKNKWPRVVAGIKGAIARPQGGEQTGIGLVVRPISARQMKTLGSTARENVSGARVADDIDKRPGPLAAIGDLGAIGGPTAKQNDGMVRLSGVCHVARIAMALDGSVSSCNHQRELIHRLDSCAFASR